MKPVLSGHSKIDKRNVLKIGGSLVKVECNAEFSRALGKTFDQHKAIIGLENIFLGLLLVTA